MPTMLQADCHLDIDRLWELFKETGEACYRNLLVDRYHYLVERTATHLHQRLPGAVELDDLISVGVFGLMSAVESFDRNRAVQFKTYCVHRIRGAILDELRQTDWVPRTVRRRASELSTAVQSLQLHLGRRPTECEIADELGVDEFEVEKLRRYSTAPRVTSFDEMCGEGEDSEGMRRLNLVAAKKAHTPCRRARRRELLDQLTHGLSRTEKLILVLYYCEDLTMKEIGVTLGLSESRVSQMHSLLVTRLRAKASRGQPAFSALRPAL